MSLLDIEAVYEQMQTLTKIWQAAVLDTAPKYQRAHSIWDVE